MLWVSRSSGSSSVGFPQTLSFPSAPPVYSFSPSGVNATLVIAVIGSPTVTLSVFLRAFVTTNLFVMEDPIQMSTSPMSVPVTKYEPSMAHAALGSSRTSRGAMPL